MAMTLTPQVHEEIEVLTPGRRRKVTKFALAGVAVLGIGAALTSAAWTDNVWFQGDAESGTAILEGSITGVDGTYLVSDEGSIQLDMGTFAVGPDQDTVETVWVRNAGTVPLRLDAVNAVGTGLIFTDQIDSDADSVPDTGAATIAATGLDTELDPGEELEITVTVTGGDWDEGEYQGQVGAITLEVVGTTDL